MKPINCWVAQDNMDFDGKTTYFHATKPREKSTSKGKSFHTKRNMYLGMNLIGENTCVECVIISKEEYEKLKELQNDTTC